MNPIKQELQTKYESEGYTLVPHLFKQKETQALRDHFMVLRESGRFPGDSEGVDTTSNDPLRKFPRMIHMHRWDDLSLRWLLDRRLNGILTEIAGEEPLAVQTMLYFKPPGARGQALHQDQFYLRAKPGTCLAAWLALDDCDEENGCMRVVPGSHNWPLLCTQRADTTQSFSDVTVPIPEGVEIRPVIMKAGDVLFFHGQLVHGSYPNTSGSRFRRALIGHYITGDASQVGEYYHPVLRMDGSVVDLAFSEGGGPCGVWAGRGIELREGEKAEDLHE